MEKLNINLYEGADEATYLKDRAEFIAEYETYEAGSFFETGKYIKNPAVGEAKWNAKHPEGYESWKGDRYHLNANGEQMLIDKVNELVDAFNALNTK